MLSAVLTLRLDLPRTNAGAALAALTPALTQPRLSPGEKRSCVRSADRADGEGGSSSVTQSRGWKRQTQMLLLLLLLLLRGGKTGGNQMKGDECILRRKKNQGEGKAVSAQLHANSLCSDKVTSKVMILLNYQHDY